MSYPFQSRIDIELWMSGGWTEIARLDGRDSCALMKDRQDRRPIWNCDKENTKLAKEGWGAVTEDVISLVDRAQQVLQ